jgi:hypothetical protein
LNDDDLIEKLKKNILSLDWAMDDAAYHGFTADKIRGVRFAINKILEGTDITIETLIKEMHEKKWFQI